MTEQITRAIPSPATLAQPPRPVFDRDRWEADLLSSELHPDARLVGLVLAHCAGTSGYLPADGPQNAHRVAKRTGMSVKRARVSLFLLEEARFLQRPSLDTWQPQTLARPATLVRPVQATRSEPAHPSEAEG